ncbi:MAG: TetR/AcrR family transcriptional regulator [Nevskia sp.]|nr:TetR/AcrR family transcriptional regulator [Nevskia sp.]
MKRRSYNSPLRRQQAEETRSRIVSAGVKIVHKLPRWDWQGLTFRAVGELAGVTERTVHRHFSTERKLRDAILQRLVEESGVDLEGLELRDFAKVTSRLFEYLTSFAVSPEPVKDPSFAVIDQTRRGALLGAVTRATPDWPQVERLMAAALLDVLWNVPTYERMLGEWLLDPKSATRATVWAIKLVEEAIRSGRRPGP